MTDIVLWRHADAEAGVPDLARALTHKGDRQARRVARWLHDRLPDDAVVWSSPAKRAQQTAHALAHFGRELVTVDAFAPSATLDDALEALRGIAPDATVVAVGHQPTLGEVVARLLQSDADWPIRKGALVWLCTGAENEGARQLVLRAAVAPDLV
jgi:phosphohistidine phosphatase